MDWDLWIRLACRGEVVALDAVIAQTREYRETKTASGGFRRWRELRVIMKRHGASGWSPGAIAYGLDTLRRKWPAVFGPSTVPEQRDQEGHRLPRLFRPLHRLVHRWIVTQTGYAQGVFVDGWAIGPRLCRSAVEWQTIDSLGSMGRFLRRNLTFPLEIEVRVGGIRGVTTVTGQGPFRIEIELGQTPASRMPWRSNCAPRVSSALPEIRVGWPSSLARSDCGRLECRPFRRTITFSRISAGRTESEGAVPTRSRSRSGPIRRRG